MYLVFLSKLLPTVYILGYSYAVFFLMYNQTVGALHVHKQQVYLRLHFKSN